MDWSIRPFVSSSTCIFKIVFFRIDSIVAEKINEIFDVNFPLKTFSNSRFIVLQFNHQKWLISKSQIVCFDFTNISLFRAKKTTTTASKPATPKVPEVLLKKRKLYADQKARRLRAKLQAEKVREKSMIRRKKNKQTNNVHRKTDFVFH